MTTEATTKKYAKPSDLLADLDSHSIYNAAILDECDFDTSSVPTYSLAQQARAIEARGLGGTLNANAGERSINGWEAAEALARHFLGHDPGAMFLGRGRIFRACRDALAEAGY